MQQGLGSKEILSRAAKKFYPGLMQYFLLVMFLFRTGLAFVRPFHRIMEFLGARIAVWISIAL